MVWLINVLYWVYISVLLISFIYGIANRNKLGKAIQFLVAIIGFSLVCELAGEVLFRTSGTNFPTFHILNIGLIILYPFAYKSFWQPFRYGKALVSIGFALAILFIISVIRSEKGLMEFPSFSSAILSLTVVVFALVSFYKQLKDPVLITLHKQPLFLFNAGNIVFYTVTFFVFGYYNYFNATQNSIPNWFPFLFWICNMILYGAYFLALKLEITESKLRARKD